MEKGITKKILETVDGRITIFSSFCKLQFTKSKDSWLHIISCKMLMYLSNNGLDQKCYFIVMGFVVMT